MEPTLFGAGLQTPPSAGPKVSWKERNEFRSTTRRLFGAGLQTPPSAGPKVSRRGRGWRPCHNLVRDCENSGKLFPACSYAERCEQGK